MTENNNEPKNFSDRVKEIFSTTQLKRIEEYARDNKIDTAAYVLLVIGFIIALFNPFLGSGLIGVLAGYYFYDDILEVFSDLSVFRQVETIKLSILLVFSILVFLAYPFFFIGAALSVAILQLIQLSNKKPK